MINQMTKFGGFAAANPEIVRGALRSNFSVASLSRVGTEHGCSIEEQEIQDEFQKIVKNSNVHVRFVNGEGELRELTIDEAGLVAGGVATVVTVVWIAAAVYTYVAVGASVAVVISFFGYVAAWG
jgi:hypothetical protein